MSAKSANVGQGAIRRLRHLTRRGWVAHVVQFHVIARHWLDRDGVPSAVDERMISIKSQRAIACYTEKVQQSRVQFILKGTRTNNCLGGY